MVAIRKKIKDLNDLAKIIKQERTKGKKIVHCHGVFDLLHIGHIRYFEQARRMGDILIVTVTPDRYVDKGPGRPAFTETLRVEAIASLNCVDYVAINQWPTAEETLRLLRPDVYVKGSEFKNIPSDMTGKIAKEEQVVREMGATLAFTDDIVFSSSNLINRYFSDFPEELQEYLHLFRKRYKLNDILGILDNLQNLKVVVIGDTILDEYQYCQAIGKSSKDPILALKYQSHEIFAGGVLAVANHVANFANRVQLITMLGERDSHEQFIRSQLNPNITAHFIFKKNAPTLIKRRFIEGYSLNKLFEIYVMDDSGLTPSQDREMSAWLKNHLSEYDLVIAADFGHGAISRETIKTLESYSKYLAVNTQANAGNRGFHSITRYERADYVCLAEHEIRLETRNLSDDISPMMVEIASKLNCGRFVVTVGRRGALLLDNKEGFVVVPSFAHNVVDRVGAGDAFFAVTSLLGYQNIPNEVTGFIGNVAGALAVGVIGNKKSITKLGVQKYITSLMK